MRGKGAAEVDRKMPVAANTRKERKQVFLVWLLGTAKCLARHSTFVLWKTARFPRLQSEVCKVGLGLPRQSVAWPEKGEAGWPCGWRAWSGASQTLVYVCIAWDLPQAQFLLQEIWAGA